MRKDEQNNGAMPDQDHNNIITRTASQWCTEGDIYIPSVEASETTPGSSQQEALESFREPGPWV